MSLLQKIAFWLLLAGALTLGVLGYRYLKSNKEPAVKVTDMLPDSCDILLSFNDLREFSNSLNSKNLLWQELSETECMSGFSSHLNLFDSLLTNDPVLSANVSGQRLFFARYGEDFILATLFRDPKELPDFAQRFVKATSGKDFLELNLEAQGGMMAVSDSRKLLSAFFRKKTNSLSSSALYGELSTRIKSENNVMFVADVKHPAFIRRSISDIVIKPDRIVIKGWAGKDSALFMGDERANLIEDPGFVQSIPLLCTSFDVYAIRDLTEQAPRVSEWWSEVNDSAMFNAKEQFLRTVNDWMVVAYMPSGNRSLILNTTDPEKIRELIPYMRDSSETLPMNGFRLLNSGKGFGDGTFSIWKDLDLKYLLQIDNKIIITASREDAEIYVNAANNNTSMLNNQSFRLFASRNFDAGFHYLHYAGTDGGVTSSPILAQLISKSDLAMLKKQGSVSMSSAYKEGFRQFRINLTYTQENDGDEPNVLWTLRADSALITPPYLFSNHVNGGNDLAFQTSDLKLNLSNATGKLLWYKQLDERIISEIHTVDAFKNGKFQLLFNTAHYLHLIDRNGNYVQGYPVRLPAEATNALSVFDYEGKKDLRLFIACADRKIYNYSIWGIKQEGFKTFPVLDIVKLPVKYCRVGPSDYLITADRSGQIYAFSRKGEGRIDFRNKVIENAEDIEVVAGNNIGNTYLLYYDPVNHLLEKISLMDVKTIQKLEQSENMPAVALRDFDNNSITDFIVANAGKLEAYDINGHLLFSKPLPEDSRPVSIVHYKSGIRNITGINEGDRRLTRVLFSDQSGFREYRSTMPVKECDLFRDNRSYLLITEANLLKCVKL